MILCYQPEQAIQILAIFMYISFLRGAPMRGAFVVMKIKSKNRHKPEPRLMYICNRRRCLHCVKECNHTAQIEYALYKDHSKSRFECGSDGKMWELKQ